MIFFNMTIVESFILVKNSVLKNISKIVKLTKQILNVKNVMKVIIYKRINA